MESGSSLHLILKSFMKKYILIGMISLAACKSNKTTLNVPKTDCPDCPKQGATYQGKHGK
jgi:hypothetical protein